jgi:hypothetical protein
MIYVLHERMLQYAAGVMANLAMHGLEELEQQEQQPAAGGAVGIVGTMVEQGVVEAIVQLLSEEDGGEEGEEGAEEAVSKRKRRFGRRGARVAPVPTDDDQIDRSTGPVAAEELGVVCSAVQALAVLAKQADEVAKLRMVSSGVARVVSALHRPYSPSGGQNEGETLLPPTFGTTAKVGIGVLVASATVLAELAQIDSTLGTSNSSSGTSNSSSSISDGSTREQLLDDGIGYALAALLSGESTAVSGTSVSAMKGLEKEREQVLLLASRAVGDICSVDDFGGMGLTVAGPAEANAAVGAEGEGQEEGQQAGAGFYSGGADMLAAALAGGTDGAPTNAGGGASKSPRQLSQQLSPAELSTLRAARAARLAKQGVLPPLVAAARAASYSRTRAHGELLRTATRAVTALSCCLDRVGQLLQLGALEPVLRLSELAQVGENASLGHVATALVNFSAADEHEGRHVSNSYAYIPALTSPRAASTPTDGGGEEEEKEKEGGGNDDAFSTAVGAGAPGSSAMGPLLGLLSRTLDAHILGLALLALLQCARHGPSRKPMVHAVHAHTYYGHTPGHAQPQPQPQQYQGVVASIVKLCTATTDAKCLAYGAQCLGTLALDEANRAPMVEQGVVTPLVQMCARAATATAQAKDSGDADEISDALEEVCANAAGALGILALHKPSRAHIVRQGAVPVLVALCGRGGRLAGAVGADGEKGHGLTVLGNAAGALANLTLHEESRPRLVHEGAVAVLVPLLRHQPKGAGDATVIGNAAQALAKLSLVDAARPVMIELGVVPPLVKICRGDKVEGGTSYDVRTVSYAAEALASLAVDETHRGLLVREGALPPLIELATITTEPAAPAAAADGAAPSAPAGAMSVMKPSKTVRRVIASAASALAQLAQHDATAARLLQLGAMRPLILLCEQYDNRSPAHAARTHLGGGPSAVRAVQAAVETIRHIGRRPECRVAVVRSGGARAAAFVALHQNYNIASAPPPPTSSPSAATPPGAPGVAGGSAAAAAAGVQVAPKAVQAPSQLDEAMLMHASGVLVNLAVEASTRSELVRGGGEGRLDDRAGMVVPALGAMMRGSTHPTVLRHCAAATVNLSLEAADGGLTRRLMLEQGGVGANGKVDARSGGVLLHALVHLLRFSQDARVLGNVVGALGVFARDEFARRRLVAPDVQMIPPLAKLCEWSVDATVLGNIARTMASLAKDPACVGALVQQGAVGALVQVCVRGDADRALANATEALLVLATPPDVTAAAAGGGEGTEAETESGGKVVGADSTIMADRWAVLLGEGVSEAMMDLIAGEGKSESPAVCAHAAGCLAQLCLNAAAPGAERAKDCEALLQAGLLPALRELGDDCLMVMAEPPLSAQTAIEGSAEHGYVRNKQQLAKLHDEQQKRQAEWARALAACFEAHRNLARVDGCRMLLVEEGLLPLLHRVIKHHQKQMGQARVRAAAQQAGWVLPHSLALEYATATLANLALHEQLRPGFMDPQIMIQLQALTVSHRTIHSHILYQSLPLVSHTNGACTGADALPAVACELVYLYGPCRRPKPSCPCQLCRLHRYPGTR